MLPFFILLMPLISSVVATPPACFLSCVAESARTCTEGLSDVTCLCAAQSALIGCLVDICPYGTFESARDHFLGTCLEHEKPTYGMYPPGYNPDKISHSKISTSTKAPSSTATPSSPSATSTSTLTSQPMEPTSVPQPLPDPSDDGTCDKDITYDPECDEKPLNIGNYDECIWEEERFTDENGYIIIIRKPVQVPDKYKIPNSPLKRKKITILKPKEQVPPPKDKSVKWDPEFEANYKKGSRYLRLNY